jgi:hypothetical protein
MKIVLILLVLAIAGFAVLVSMQPDVFRVSRSATFNASAADVFANVNNLAKWQAWSPWARLDPNAVSTFEGPTEGTGAIMRWKGNSQVGEGSMTITESVPSQDIKFRLDFLKPMQGTNIAEFTFKPDGDKTLVTWSMDGTNNFIGKAIGLIMNCEKMVGAQFDAGLANLRAVVEPRG